MSHVREHTTCRTAHSILGRFFLSPHVLNVHLIYLCAQEAVLGKSVHYNSLSWKRLAHIILLRRDH